MSSKNKLELTWIGKDNLPRLEPRILMEDSKLSYHSEKKVSENEIFDNKLIFGDNLLALKALEDEFTGKIKCIFIDPPYNTGNAFEHYDDGVEHSLWLNMMKARLDILKNLLSDNGSIWITIDDTELHYLKVMCDEIFGRTNFVSNIIWQHSVQSKNDSKTISLQHNSILVYKKTDAFKMMLLPRTEEHNVAYKNPDNDPRGLWRSGDVRSPNHRENLKYEVSTPNGNIIPPPEKGWRWNKETFQQKVETSEITFVDNETRVLRKIYLADQKGRVAESIWLGADVGTTRQATNEVSTLVPDQPKFATPKPEKLLERIIRLATSEGDIVLDSFAGSGTTGAVAHKMKRRWIMIELGEHCNTHIIPRMQQVINGEDQGGISKDLNWQGGGGFNYYQIAPSLLEKDKFGNWIISSKYNSVMLAEAVCKHKGFSYMPDESIYWKQGYSTENDYIFTTTQFITREVADHIQEQMSLNETLLICCKAFTANPNDYPMITIEKIPTTILKNCEYGRDDYSLKVNELVQEENREQLSMFVEDDSDE